MECQFRHISNCHAIRGDLAIGWATPACGIFGRHGSDVMHSPKGIVSMRSSLSTSSSSCVFSTDAARIRSPSQGEG